MNIALWEWPQWLYIAMTLGGMMVVANLHGKPKKGNENFWKSILLTIPAWIILYFGGFFK